METFWSKYYAALVEYTDRDPIAADVWGSISAFCHWLAMPCTLIDSPSSSAPGCSQPNFQNWSSLWCTQGKECVVTEEYIGVLGSHSYLQVWIRLCLLPMASNTVTN